MLKTFVMAMVPIIELRGAIPYGAGIAGLPIWQATLIAVLGNLLPVPFLVVFTRDIFSWMRKKSDKLNNIVQMMERKADRNKDVVLRYEFWGLMILVAIPLPGTGAWTGALVAAMMDMQLKRAFPAIALGVVAAAFIVTWVTYGASTFL
ncbi:small multi-drug export protein [Mogibacterium neglectum]|uniref:COG2426 family protein n=1 Tax=Mogibacterium neglectum TaxID=114528 RepID=UPI00272A0B82|nr:small multi-drug export protein [Mogibacterium neglectum]WLD75658.1 small multi-drug export protein [Mogibacterium neglectum]